MRVKTGLSGSGVPSLPYRSCRKGRVKYIPASILKGGNRPPHNDRCWYGGVLYQGVGFTWQVKCGRSAAGACSASTLVRTAEALAGSAGLMAASDDAGSGGGSAASEVCALPAGAAEATPAAGAVPAPDTAADSAGDVAAGMLSASVDAVNSLGTNGSLRSRFHKSNTDNAALRFTCQPGSRIKVLASCYELCDVRGLPATCTL
jgi:hypothetical protein